MTVFIVFIFMVNTFYFISLILIFNKQIKYVYQAEVYIWFISEAFENLNHQSVYAIYRKVSLHKISVAFYLSLSITWR